ncbi:MAG: hypothetical protein DMF06_11635 [Verrucomicrobia bacterium]|nr:MAG: hypothetical protein DMF06_11635 [Verrucomicrobiota bacterium]
MKMTKKILVLTLISAATLSAWAAYNQNIIAIFGSGNPDIGWTTDTNNGIVLGLRGKDRVNSSTANINGVYGPYATGVVPPNNNRATWNWEFSINSGSVNLSTYDYYVGIDTDPSKCINYTVVDALTNWTDNSYGNNGTANGQGVEGTSGPTDNYATIYNIAQQSQNLVFAGGNPTLPGTYSYELYAVAKGNGPTGVRLASVGITVVVGTGGAFCVPTTANQCKNGGWMTRTRANGSTFKNQGDCIQYVNTGH